MIARVAMTIIFGELLKRMPRFRRAHEQVDCIPSMTFHSPRRLDLTLA